jgi:hypothetical protein
MNIIPTWPPRDPLRFIIHGFFGMIMGSFMGISVYMYSPIQRYSDSWIPLALHIGIGAIVIGLIAGVYGDDFWKNLRSWW